MLFSIDMNVIVNINYGNPLYLEQYLTVSNSLI